MHHRCLLAGLFGVALLSAQDWKNATDLAGVDLNGLTGAQKGSVLKLLRENGCTCGCDMKLAECRTKDPNCSYSRGLARVIVEAIKQGKSEADTLAAMKASPMGHPPAQDTRLLGDPVAIPTAGAPSIGPAAARITLVEFSDFQCPYCVLAVSQLKAVLKAYPTEVKLIFKQFPLDTHSQAALAAAAALAAHKQGRFWPLHDSIFEQKGKISRATIIGLASGLGVDMKRFESDLDSTEIRQAVAKDVEDGERAGVAATPTLFIDGQLYRGRLALEDLKPVLDAELKKPVKSASGKN